MGQAGERTHLQESQALARHSPGTTEIMINMWPLQIVPGLIFVPLGQKPQLDLRVDHKALTHHFVELEG